jgi:PAS domain S-box-containing protein
MIDALRRWVELNPLVSDIYTFRRLADGRVVLLVDAETDYDGDGRYVGAREMRTRPGEVYPQAGDELHRAFAGEANFMSKTVTDRWGTWVRMHVPMFDREGRVEAVLGIDYRADNWRRETAVVRRLAIAHLAILFAVIASSGAAAGVYRAELAARAASESRLTMHVRQTPLAFVEWGPDLRVIRWNPAAERIFGYTEAEALGRSFEDLIVPESARAEVREVCRRLGEEKIPRRHQNENIRKDGGLITCEWHNVPLVDERGEFIAVASHAQDVTERVCMERHIRQGQKMEAMGQLAGGVAHEFNNLLTPMLMQIGQIGMTYGDDARLLEMLRPVEDAIGQAAQLNQRILAVGRRHAEGRSAGNLNHMIEASVDLLRHTLDRRIELELRLGAALPPAYLSKGAIMQVLMNLVLNARDTLVSRLEAGGESGWRPRILISTTRDLPAPGAVTERLKLSDECLVLSVADNGEGVSPELSRRIFEPFFTTKPAGKATGLGLAVVWGVVDSLGGGMDVQSTPGAGSTFRVYLPVAQLDAEVVSPVVPIASPVRVASATRRILLVEDNALVRETFCAALRGAGHEVDWAENGEVGQAALREPGSERPHQVLVTDLNMPRLSGQELIRRVRARGWRGAIVVVSGLMDAGLEDELRRLGVDRVLRKPIRGEELLAAIDEADVGGLRG